MSTQYNIQRQTVAFNYPEPVIIDQKSLQININRTASTTNVQAEKPNVVFQANNFTATR